PVAVNASNQKYNLNTDTVINEADRLLMNDFFRRYRFGEDGVVDQSDIDAVTQCLGQTPAVAGVPHLYDLDGDDDVDVNDVNIARDLATVPIGDNVDVDGNGVLTIEDLYAQRRAPVDVNRDGTINDLDAESVESALRENEKTDLKTPR
ncbi:MAG: hypothetical protein ACK54H_03570, partial [Phycisphaerales bacterium]